MITFDIDSKTMAKAESAGMWRYERAAAPARPSKD